MKHFFLLVIFCLSQNLVFSQSGTINSSLDEIVISANKTQTPYYAVGSSITIITSEEISRKQTTSVIDLLREVPGVSVIQQGGPGKLSYISLRGANTNHTLVIVDGAKVNDASSPNNAFDFSTLTTHDIERIEILRGPQSTLYGSYAIAGVINIITKSGNGIPHYSLTADGGSNSYYKGVLSASGSYGLMNYFISALRSGSNGVSASNSKYGNTEKDGFINNAITSQIGFNLLDNLKFNLIYKFGRADIDLDQSEMLGDDPNYIYQIEEQLFKSGISLSLFEGKWEQFFNVSLTKRFAFTFDDFDEVRPFTYSDNYNRSQRIKLDWQNNLSFIPNNLLTFGVESETEKAYTSYLSESEWGPYESIFPEQSVTTNSLYLQNQVNIANQLFTSVGIRYDHHQKFGNVTTFRISPAYYISSTGTKIKAAYGNGFKAPSLYNLFDPLFGNPDLKPEKSKGWEAGFEQYFDNGNYSLGITYFDLKLENMFGYDANYVTINIAEAESKGIELFMTAKFLEKVSVTANYTYNKTKDNYSNSDDFKKRLLRRPQDQLFVNINFNPTDIFNLNTQIKYSGKRDDKDFSFYPAQRVEMDDYAIVNLAASYKLLDYLQLTGRIENVFNKDYEEVLFYGTLGRSFYLGINFSL